MFVHQRTAGGIIILAVVQPRWLLTCNKCSGTPHDTLQGDASFFRGTSLQEEEEMRRVSETVLRGEIFYPIGNNLDRLNPWLEKAFWLQRAANAEGYLAKRYSNINAAC